jgi:hypothetical protein
MRLFFLYGRLGVATCNSGHLRRIKSLLFGKEAASNVEAWIISMSATPQVKSFSYCGCASFVVGLLSRLAIAGIFVGFSLLLFGKYAYSNVKACLKLTSATPQLETSSCCGSSPLVVGLLLRLAIAGMFCRNKFIILRQRCCF